MNMAFTVDSDAEVIIDYTNYKGERSTRRIRPDRIWFGRNEYHPTPGWLLEALDVAKDARRTFAMKDIHRWEETFEYGSAAHGT